MKVGLFNNNPTPPSNPMSQGSRFAGIDLFRGIAVLTVVLLHLPAGWSPEFSAFANFAVPFFLATSFYLAVHKCWHSGKPYSLRSRFSRLLIPYLVWSLIYLLYRVAKYFVAGETGSLVALTQHPLFLILRGEVTGHLYFLPLLLTGTFLIKLLEISIRQRTPPKQFAAAFILSLILYEAFLAIGGANAFQPAPFHVAWQGVALKWLEWGLRCLPYMFAAAFLTHPLVDRILAALLRQPAIAVALFAAFLLTNLSSRLIPFTSVLEVVSGYLALLLALAISNWFKGNRLISNLSACSFGIYLIHIIPLEVVQIVHARIQPIFTFSPSTLNFWVKGLLSFALAWMMTDYLLKQKRAARILFGT